MTTANKITILRILLIPFFVVELGLFPRNRQRVHRLLALLTFAVTAILDGVDGYIARRYNQRSELGAILDPLADQTAAPVGHHYIELRPRALFGADSTLAYGHHTRTRFAAAHRHCRRSIHRRQGCRASAHHGENRDGAANDRGPLDFTGLGPRFECALAQGLDVWRGDMHGRVGLLYIWDGVKQLGSHPASLPTVKSGRTGVME